MTTVSGRLVADASRSVFTGDIRGAAPCRQPPRTQRRTLRAGASSWTETYRSKIRKCVSRENTNHDRDVDVIVRDNFQPA